MVIGDTIEISADLSDYYNGSYVIKTVPTTNTYTITPYRGDPGAGAVSDGQLYIEGETATTGMDAGDVILLETGDQLLNELTRHEFLKVETKALANVWLENTTNWDAPFNSAILDEANQTILLERGGSYLYPPLEFPMAESGTVSIDMSFNSDVLLEAYTTGDLGMSDSGYLLDEAAGGVGNGPARYISLEEDTEGIEEGHIAQNIPYMETAVNWTNSQTTGWLILQEDVVEDLPNGVNHSGGILYEDDSNPVLGQRMLTEYSHVTTSDEGRFKRIVPTIENVDHFSTSIFDRILYEDYDVILGEDNVKITQEVESITMPDKEVLFDFLTSVRDGILTEDGLNLIGEDADPNEGIHASRLITENDHLKPTKHQIEFEMAGEVLILEDGFTHLVTEGGTPNRMLLTHAVSGIKSGQSSYMSPSRLNGTVAIDHNGTTVTGAGTAFSTELAVGDVFQTSDENIILEAEGSDQQVILETDEILAHEDVLITEVQSDVISYVSGLPIKNLKWYISKEDSTKSVFGQSGTNVLGSYTINTVDEQYNIIGEDSNQDLEISLESNTPGQPGVIEQETSEFTTGISLLLETDDKMLFTEPGEFKVASISNDTSLVVTRKHWGGTDVVPFWKQTTETEVTAVVSYL